VLLGIAGETDSDCADSSAVLVGCARQKLLAAPDWMQHSSGCAVWPDAVRTWGVVGKSPSFARQRDPPSILSR